MKRFKERKRKPRHPVEADLFATFINDEAAAKIVAATGLELRIEHSELADKLNKAALYWAAEAQADTPERAAWYAARGFADQPARANEAWKAFVCGELSLSSIYCFAFGRKASAEPDRKGRVSGPFVRFVNEALGVLGQPAIGGDAIRDMLRDKQPTRS